MKKMPFIIFGLTALATIILLAGYRKKKTPSTDDIDGGVRKNLTDPDAPKSITSTEITSFKCVFSTTTLDGSYGFDGKVYDLEAKLNDDKICGCFDYYNRSGEGNKLGFETDLRFMESLYEIVARYDFAKHNGYSYSVSGLPDMYGAKINITFASGENIYAYNNQSNFLTVDAMRDLITLFEEYPDLENPVDDNVCRR